MTLSDIASSLAVICSIVALILAYRKAPHETDNMDADTAKTYEEAAALAGERANRLEKHVELLNQKVREQGLLIDELIGRDNSLRFRVDALEVENCELIERIKILESENGDLREWAAKLVMQIKNLGGTPVAVRGKKS